MPFNIAAAQVALVENIAKLEPFIIGLHPSPDTLEGRAAYINALCKLVAEHVEDCMADAAANQSAHKIDETSARELASVGSDLADAVMRAAHAMEMV